MARTGFLILFLTCGSLAPLAGEEPRPWLAWPYWDHAFDTPITEVLEVDLDGDGWSEFVVLTEDGRLSAIDLGGQPGWSVALSPKQDILTSADLDGDGHSEILAGVTTDELRHRSSFAVIDERGVELWRRSFSYSLGFVGVVHPKEPVKTAILLAFDNPVPAPVLLLDSNGETLWTYEPPGGPSVVVEGDLSSDGRAALLIGTRQVGQGDAVICALTTEGEPLWVSEPVIAGFPGGETELLELAELGPGREKAILAVGDTGHRERHLCRFSTKGEKQWCTAIEAGTQAKGIVALSDQGKTLIFPLTSNRLTAFDTSGSLLWESERRGLDTVSSELVDVDGDGSGEIVAIFHDFEPEVVTRLVAFDPGGREARHWSFPGFPHSLWRLDAGSTWLFGAGQAHVFLNERGLRVFPAPTNRGFSRVGDFNHDGFGDALLASDRRLSLLALPDARAAVKPHRVWQAEEDTEYGGAAVFFGAGGWIVAAGSPQTVGKTVIFPGHLRLISPRRHVDWRRRLTGHVAGLWVGSPFESGRPEVYLLTTDSEEIIGGEGLEHMAEGSGELIALDDVGEQRWRRQLPGPPTALTGLAGDEGARRLIVGFAGRRPTVQGYDGAGNRAWQIEAPGPVLRVAASPEGYYAAGILPEEREGFLLKIGSVGREVWQRRLAGRPRALEVTDIDGDGRQEILIGSEVRPLSCFDAAGKKLWSLDIAGQAIALAAADLDGDGLEEIAVITEDRRSEQGQLHVVDARGRLTAAVGLPAPLVALASSGLGKDRPARIYVAVEPQDEAAEILALDPTGRILWTLEAGEKITHLHSHREAQGQEGVFYVTADGRIGLVAPTYRPPPLLAAPELALDDDQFSAFTVTAGAPAKVMLEVYRQARDEWESTTAVTMEAGSRRRARWPVQPFGLLDVGRAARFRFRFEDADYSGHTEELAPALRVQEATRVDRVPVRWRYLQRAATTALVLAVFLAAPVWVLLYRQMRRRGPRYRDLVCIVEAELENGPLEVTLVDGRRRRSFRRGLAARETLQAELDELEQELFEQSENVSSQIRAVRDLLRHLLLDDPGRRVVFDSRRPIRFRLDFRRAPGLPDLPWELLLLADDGAKGLLHPKVAILRQVSLDQPETILLPLVHSPLRLLVVQAGDLEDHRQERNRLEAVLEEPRRKGRVHLEVLEGAGAVFENVQHELQNGYDIFHFIGHGKLQNGDVQLVFPGDYPVEAAQLRELFAGRRRTGDRGPVLVVLNHCHAAQGLAKLGPGLLSPRGVLAAVGMSGEISGPAAGAFSAGFYPTFLRTGRIDHAVTVGRRTIVSGLPGEAAGTTLEWIRPVVYTCVEDGRLFEWD